MKYIFLLFIISSIIGCNSDTKPKEYTDSEKQRIAEIKDSLSEDISKKVNDEVYGDTIGVSSSPVKVISYKIVASVSITK